MRIIVALLFVGMMGLMNAQDYCMKAPVGYGSATTGGGNATPVVVTTKTQLQTALSASGAGVVIVKGAIQVDYLSLKVSDKTILGLPGSSLYTNVQVSGGSGILYLKEGSNNVIMRNVTFIGPGAWDVNGRDLLTLDGATNIWIDHCDFQDGMDGNLDTKGNSDNITISWCEFSYLKAPKTTDYVVDGTPDHRFSNLIGSSSSDCPTDKQFSMTWQYCWWAQGCVERQVRARNAQLHLLNCYWNSDVSKTCIGLEDGSGGVGTYCYVEGSVFAATGVYAKLNYGGTPDIQFVDCMGSGLSNSATLPAAPGYLYRAIPSLEVEAAVTRSCGSGATLQVTEAGGVSSSCAVTSVTASGTELFTVSPVVVTTWADVIVSEYGAVVECFDLKGKKLFHQVAVDSNVYLDMSAFSSGVYLISVTSQGRVDRQKVVKR
ncbi:pectate lyase [Breznakibacter xylanolyticus]|uniref:Pectate lyase n=1 Tax=Breznakibacter xylanolyticus TaxID=990 RepID=A0A2W7N0B9_9BACT|nr:T9SS type A sorting domain-containing protein [Breznakibacter xylanolyticus]PZX11877.1 pectate lyase [Breznakibacter xylanolyticus]